MSYIIVAVSALSVSALTLYSGFGLGTLLMPVFALFFPLEIAVAATAVVHASNSVFKIGVVGRNADRHLVIGFGLPAIVAAFAGAATLGFVSHFGEIASYTVGSRLAVITPMKLGMGALMLIFALLELLPGLRELKFDRRYLFLGGILSGFFGGFSGHQGALRSAFLAKVRVSTEAFVGTNAVIGFMVDMARITMYAMLFIIAGNENPLGPDQWPLVLTGMVAAFSGVLLGRRFLDKITMGTVQAVTGVLLLVIAGAVGSGLI